MENRIHSIGVFIDGGYYAKMDEGLRKSSGMSIDMGKLLEYIRDVIAAECNIECCTSQITECHYFRGRFRVHDANQKQLLYSERKFEDTLIENDVIFHYKHLREIDGNIIEKGIDVWFALEAYELATIRKFDYVVLITGDADHEMLVKKLKALKTQVILLTGDFTTQSATSKLLKEETVIHIDLGQVFADDGEMMKEICK
ncbi:MAG: NYN domain-containing protein [Bacteroidales bacterium]|nr:NYN domain-containing protein [Bacteroidales bacterium]